MAGWLGISGGRRCGCAGPPRNGAAGSGVAATVAPAPRTSAAARARAHTARRRARLGRRLAGTAWFAWCSLVCRRNLDINAVRHVACHRGHQVADAEGMQLGRTSLGDTSPHLSGYVPPARSPNPYFRTLAEPPIQRSVCCTSSPEPSAATTRDRRLRDNSKSVSELRPVSEFDCLGISADYARNRGRLTPNCHLIGERAARF